MSHPSAPGPVLPAFPPRVRARPHGAWYVIPSAALVSSLVCVSLALLIRLGDKALWILTDSSSSSADWQTGWDHHYSTSNTFLTAAFILAPLGCAGFVAIATARAKSTTANRNCSTNARTGAGKSPVAQ